MLDLMKVYLPLKQLMANNCNLFSENYYLLKDDVQMIYVVWYWYKRGLLVNYVYYNSRVYANFGTWCSAVIRNYIIYWDRDPVAWGVCVCISALISRVYKDLLLVSFCCCWYCCRKTKFYIGSVNLENST